MAQYAREGASGDALEIAQMVCELNWLNVGRPYYRVYPDYAKMFQNTSLNVPVRYLNTAYPAQAVRFQTGHEPRFGDITVRSYVFSIGRLNDMAAHLGVGDFSEFAHLTIGVMLLNTLAVGDTEPRMVGGFTRWDNRTELDKTVAEILAERADGVGADDRIDQLILGLWPITMSVAFLATGGDKLIEPDIVNSEFSAYLAAVNAKDKKQVAGLVDSSLRLRGGRQGHTIGRADSVLGRRADYHDPEKETDPDEVARHLTYSHLRGGHVRYIRRGEQQVGVWVRPTVVRPDLPPPPDVRAGSRTLDSKATENRINAGGN